MVAHGKPRRAFPSRAVRNRFHPPSTNNPKNEISETMKTLIKLTALVFFVTYPGLAEAGPKSHGHKGHGGRHGHHHGRHHRGHHHGRHHGYGPRGGFVGGFVGEPVTGFDTGVVYDPLIGEAEVIRSLGEYNRDTSEALMNYEEARRRAIENHQQYVETRNELKRQWRERMLARNRRRPQPEQFVSRERSQPRLSNEEFNRTTGEIAWPEVLLDPQFDEYRAAFEAIFANPTTKESGAGSNLYRDVNAVAYYMTGQLREQIRYMSPSDYIAAKNFITRLASEAGDTPEKPEPNSALTYLK